MSENNNKNLERTTNAASSRATRATTASSSRATRATTASSSRATRATTAKSAASSRSTVADKSPVTKTRSTSANAKGASGRAISRKKIMEKRRKKKERLFLLFVLVVGIIMFFIISAIMKSALLKTKKNSNLDYVLGEDLNIYYFVTPANEDTVLTCDTDTFAPKGLGSYKLKYTAARGKLKKTKTVKINIVDYDNPYIDGPDTVGFWVGEEVDFSKFYEVEDGQPNLNKEIKTNVEVTTDEEKTSMVQLIVEDWAGHIATKEINVMVYSLTEEQKCIASVLRAFKKEYQEEASEGEMKIYYKGSTFYGIIDGALFKAANASATLVEPEDDSEEAQNKYSELYDEVYENGENKSLLELSVYKH